MTLSTCPDCRGDVSDKAPVRLWPQLEKILRRYVFGNDSPPARLLFPSYRTGAEGMLTDVRKLLERVAERTGTLYIMDRGHKRKAEPGDIRTKVFWHNVHQRAPPDPRPWGARRGVDGSEGGRALLDGHDRKDLRTPRPGPAPGQGSGVPGVGERRLDLSASRSYNLHKSLTR